MTDKIWPDWEELDSHTEEMALHIEDHGREPDAIVGIARGGLPFAVKMSHWFEAPLGYINVNLYENREKQKGPRVEDLYLGSIGSGDLVLVFDDIVDTGETMKKTLSTIEIAKPVGFNMITAAIHVKPDRGFDPDYWSVETDKWVVYPWE